uniref:glucan endo-1,3-beta-D-glucosidase n=1 Tax=Quercus lobata TaxID=97700 RepID=A0A7N2KKP3_QUELO
MKIFYQFSFSTMALSKKPVMAALLLLLLITSQGKSGLSRDPANLTHPPPPTEPDPLPTKPISPAVDDGFVSPKPEFGGSEVGFPSPESDQTDPTDPQDFRRYLVDPSCSCKWLGANKHTSPYLPDVNISYIAAGNEIKPSDPLAQSVGPAMQNLYNAVTSSNFPTQIKVSTVIDIDPTDIKLDYALLNSSGVVVQDGNLGYQNLFDAMMDSLYSALEKIGAANLTVIVTETG